MKRLSIGAVALFIAALSFPAASAAPADADGDPRIRYVTTVPGSTGGHSVVEGNRLYVGAYGLGMRIFDISNPADPKEIGRYFPGPQPNAPDNDIGVRADAVPDAAVFDGRHIAVLNGTSRTAGAQQAEFLDVTNPASPQVLWRLTDSVDGESHNGDIVDARRLWLPSGGGNGLRIFDLNPLLQTPAAAPKKLSMNNPVALWTNSPHRKGRPVGGAFTHIHDIEVYVDHPVLQPQSTWVDQDGDGIPDPTYAPRDIALLAEGGNYTGNGNTGSLFVVDITDPAKPVVLNRWLHASGGDHHPIRYHHEAQFLQGDPSVVLVTDEDLHNGCEAGGITALRVSEDLTTATELSEWFNGTGTPAANCSAHVISTHGDYVFMGSYNAGLQVIDYSDPVNPVRADQYIAPGSNAWGALYHNGYVYVGDFGPRGLDVFEWMPDVIASGTIIAANPTAARPESPGGFNEVACEFGGQPDAPPVDALNVKIPADKRDGTYLIRAAGTGPAAPYDLNVYFHDKDCRFMSGVSVNAADRDTSGPIPEGAAYAFVTNVGAGPPMDVFASISPAPPVEE